MIFHIESPSPDELDTQLSEAELVAAACRLSGHRFHTLSVLDRADLQKALKYIFMWEAPEKSKPQFSLHFSGHANREGIQIGASFVKWDGLAGSLRRAMKDHDEISPYMVFFSSCGMGRPDFSTFSKLPYPPIYIFAFENKVDWADAAHASSLLYRWLPEIRVDDRKRVQGVIERVRNLDFGKLTYFRHDETTKSYRCYPKQ